MYYRIATLNVRFYTLVAVLLWPVTAHANPAICVPKATLIAQLLDQYGEMEQPRVPASDGSPFYLILGHKPNSTLETWTIIFVREDGMACVASAGVKSTKRPPIGMVM